MNVRLSALTDSSAQAVVLKAWRVSFRSSLVRLHRWAGLSLAVLLIVIGTTGSIIAFFPELDRWLNADMLLVEPQGQPIDLLDLHQKIQAGDPKSHIYGINWPKTPNDAASFYAEGAIDPSTGAEFDTSYDSLFANPYTGDVTGKRLWGDLPFERKDVFTFIYFLHYSLVLPEFLGEVFMGTVALIWALDCIVGFVLTLPIRRRNDRDGQKEASTARSFWRRWKPAWLINTRAGSRRLIFDWHRASGLWLWLMLMVFAVSGFSFNLPSVYSRFMSRVSGYVDPEVHPTLDAPLTRPAVDWKAALALSERYMAAAAAERNFSIIRPYALLYRRDRGIYVYKVLSSRDLEIYGETSLSIDATTGALIATKVPTGDNWGNTFTAWIKSLHRALTFGFPYRVFVRLMGVLVVVLTVTGVLVYFRRRSMRRLRRSA
jgi:uncharacterized iron-regulated membrane protein